jgi:hypothetical protein
MWGRFHPAFTQLLTSPTPPCGGHGGEDGSRGWSGVNVRSHPSKVRTGPASTDLSPCPRSEWPQPVLQAAHVSGTAQSGRARAMGRRK